ncbi:hypothetical protein [Methylobacterium nodulans]|uniref:Uncharacterized protein n=1 Tax=Methylobacterium nodulans (strain LMG 21967 / CNCM I-2342 / ORS 2060) TaxID=460265 RepID=B8IDB2_METNO|nr:hypothetical protein [Methylobacterium nodulans]ACL61278.1 conserved hypothetical protein [Methylobacterium nodulans ORS 2060]
MTKPSTKKTILDTIPGLPDADLDRVSGGLNPQPLPPRWSFSLIKLQPILSSLRLPSFFSV